MSKQQWCIDQHRQTNHMYDTYLPYEFHLRMVNQVAMDYKHLLDNTKDYYTGEPYRGPRQEQVTLQDACLTATWGHDLIEDTRVSYNDVKDHLGQEAADIVFIPEKIYQLIPCKNFDGLTYVSPKYLKIDL